jgi:hypothetical protein
LGNHISMDDMYSIGTKQKLSKCLKLCSIFKVGNNILDPLALWCSDWWMLYMILVGYAKHFHIEYVSLYCLQTYMSSATLLSTW